MAWEFKREESQFNTIPEGKHRIRIKSVERAISKSSGNEMLAFQFEVSGYSSILYHYIAFLENNPKVTNRMLTQFFDSFKNIPEGSRNIQSWVGKVGACMVKLDDQDRPKISYFIKADKQDELPAWRNANDDEPVAAVPDDMDWGVF